EPVGCVQAAPGDGANLAEILADYSARKDAKAVLAREFTLPKPYQLLSSDQVETFLSDALRATPQVRPPGGTPPLNPNPLYQKAKTVFLLGGVYFDQNRTRALAYLGVYETRFDFSIGWNALKKSTNDQWEIDRTWRTCGRGMAR